MCFLRPLTVTSRSGKTATLENGIQALCDPTIEPIAVGDQVIVFGNVIIQKQKKIHENTI